MNRKTNFLVSIIVLLMLQACGQKIQYGEHPLVLDDFNFKLDLNEFFRDESIFRGLGGHSDFLVTSEDVIAERDSIMPGFIQYFTSRRSTRHPLAEYAGVYFEDLGLISDWDDEKVLMICGSSEYKSAEEIMKIIMHLKKDYGATPELRKGGFRGDNTLYMFYQQADKTVQFGVTLPDVDFIDWPERSYRGWGNTEEEEPKKVVLTDEIEKHIEEKLKEKEETSCFLFITKPEMAAVMNGQSGRSGFLVNYLRDE